MNSNPSFSIVVPVFNRIEELRRALTSILVQDFQDFEVIVIDDASTVNVKAVVDEFDSRFVYSRLKENSGPSVARSSAFTIARGQFIGFLDSDNEYFPNTLDRAQKLLNLHVDLGGVAGNYLFSGKRRRLARRNYGVISPERYRDGVYAPFDQVGFIRREVLDLWLSRNQQYFNSEVHLWLSYGLNFNHLVVDESWGTYYENASTRNSLVFDERKFTDVARFIDEYKPIIMTDRCVPLDHYLIEKFWLLRKTRRPELEMLLKWMKERNINFYKILQRKAGLRIERALEMLFFPWVSK